MEKDSKKYYWFKLKQGFFEEKTQRFLRQLPGGDTLLIIYLKLMLTATSSEGIIKYDELMPSCEEELALVLDEDVNNVRLTLTALEKAGVIEWWDGNRLYMTAVKSLTGKEGSSAERVRKHREKKKALALQCNTDETASNACNVLCNTELELQKELQLNKDIQKDLKTDNRVIEEVSRKYKNICRSLPAAEITENDLVNIAAALGAGYTFEDIWKVFHIAEENDFLKGNNEHKWQASLSWLLKPKNMKKVLSGKYDRRERGVDEEAAVSAIVAAARESPEDPEAAFDALPEAYQKLAGSPLRLRGLAKAKETAIRELVARKVKEME